MRGNHHIIVQNKRIRYEFDLHRNITVVRGESATGKTTLVQLLAIYESRGKESGIELYSDKDVTVLNGGRWKEQLSITKDSIVFIDEGNRFMTTQEFAEVLAASDNYYVLITRDDLKNLPYSVTEIYGIRISGKYAGLKPVYHEFYRIYPAESSYPGTVDFLITEDSGSGFQFFGDVSKKSGVKCISAEGKSNVPTITAANKTGSLLVVADGAAFGSEMEKLYLQILNGAKIKLYLPESFEWILLKGIFDTGNTRQILESPADFIESSEYISWERFFTKLLVRLCEKSAYLSYSKKKLNPTFLQEKERKNILNVIPDLGIRLE